MKKLIMAISVPECFKPNTQKIDIHLKGTPEGKYQTAEIIEDRPQGKWGYNTDGRLVRYRGEWRYLTGGTYKCSLCESITSKQFTYCPYCGAVMEKEGE